MKSLLCMLILLAVFVYTFALPLPQTPIADLANGFISDWDKAYTIDHLSSSESRSSDGLPLYYLIHLQPRGFIIISNNSATIPILAWSQDAEFPQADIPANLQWYLDSISEQLTMLSEAENNYVHPEWEAILAGDYSRYESTRSVAPMLQTT